MSQALLACCASAILGGCASSGTQPRAESQAGLRSLIAAERAFARRAESLGIKDAFVANLGDDGLLFRPGPVNGLAWFRDRPAARGYLSWEPEWAEISASGELGWTTGPFEFRAAGASDTVSNAGHYVTVWRRDSAGAWKMAVDIGTSHAYVQRPTDARGKVSERPATPPAATSLLARDSLLGAAGTVQRLALLAAMMHDARLHRAGMLPALGVAAVSAAIGGDDRPYVSRQLGGAVSRADDFGYTYGEYELEAMRTHSGEGGFYLRIWRRGDDGAWRVILDLAQPTP